MPVKKDETGRRYVEAEVEVPGTPEEVWQAIATGPGITSWFVPTEVEERVGGAVTANFGPGMDSLATITAWDPPHRFAADSRDGMGPGGPTIATEWSVEAKAGGTCIVRVVHAWFADGDDWDAQFEGHEHGWRSFFRILRLYLAHFRGQHGANLQLMGVGSEPTASEAWVALTGRLGIAGAGPGRRVQSAAGAPALAGQVESIGPDEHPELLLRLDAPAPGIAHLFALPMAGQVFLPVRLYLFGNQPAAVAAREGPAWQAWMARHFPMPAQPG
ncbi:SRPBCC domain-containing protein [Inquilinus sp. Marseille-Q2685]|uniref:SRPBCC family protein n=1 Tax=Inquilinus sp. Marseille-Q2685 TaxID=2866581 RepID=UPI001CE3F9C5|nr:SRPBCC domain-containing protein [Inquilinus sp. Marseille-Q2685]